MKDYILIFKNDSNVIIVLLSLALFVRFHFLCYCCCFLKNNKKIIFNKNEKLKWTGGINSFFFLKKKA